MKYSSDGVVGHRAELAMLDRFLASVPSGAAAVVLAGEAGVGKTVLWRAGVTRARRLGFRVLACSPAAAERRLPLSGFADLFSGSVLAVASEHLPGPQRQAMQEALLHKHATGAPVHHRALSAAAVSAVRVLARTSPVLLAIDDVEWLDEATSDLVAYLARRLDDIPVGLLVVARGTAGGIMPFGLARVLAPNRLALLQLDRLSPDALCGLLRAVCVGVSRPVLLRIHRATGGNPQLALEMARALVGSEPIPFPCEPLPVPPALGHLVEQRVRALPAAVREVLLYVALQESPTVSTVRVALGAATEQLSALTWAEESGVIEIHGERIELGHPLLASAVYSAASRERRQLVHRRLAAVQSDVAQRALHLALGAVGPDALIAALLERAGLVARQRGRPAEAAELFALSRRHTPPHAVTDERRRAVAAAESLFAAGDAGGARRLLEAAASRLPPGQAHARVLLRLAEVACCFGSCEEATELCQAALAEAGRDPMPAAEAHLRLAWCSTHDAPSQYAHAEAAVDILRRQEPRAAPEFLAAALASKATYALTSAGQFAPDDVVRARQLLAMGTAHHRPDNQGLAEPRAAAWARSAIGAWTKCFDLLEARDCFQQEYDMGALSGDESRMGKALAHLAEIDCWLGRWTEAREQADRSVESLGPTGQRGWLGFGLYVGALVRAHLGEADEAIDGAQAALALADNLDPYLAAHYLQALGFLELSRSDPELADHYLTRAAKLVEVMKIEEPAQFMFHGDQIEAAAMLGDRARAGQLLRRLEERLRRTPRPWLAVTTARCSAVVAASGGNLPYAAAAASRAVDAAADLPMPFEQGRALLVYGRILRRQKSKSLADDVLGRAKRTFDALGAALWSEQAAAELDRCGLWRRADPGKLTPTEDRIATLVATGLTNGEVAARLYISVKTVEANLTRVYRKLGVQGRRQLVREGLAGQQ